MLQAICFDNNTLRILDQLKLPLQEEYEVINSVADAWKAIRSMKVRGAPAIAMVGIISVAVEIAGEEMEKETGGDKNKLLEQTKSLCDYISTARPTAVNIKRECRLLVEFCQKLVNDANLGYNSMVSEVVNYSAKLLKDDVAVNKAIGDHGADHLILQNGQDDSITILTHCNTGSLATAGYGTALGVIRSLKTKGKLSHVYCTETRPYNQGARLTSWELLRDQIPATLICDNMVGALMKQRKVSAVVVGADRVVANGDVANKIGTYQIAVCAKYHQVPFYVASPRSTIDTSLESGDQIPIEERPENEMKCIGGVQIAAKEVACWNPSFDVTPAQLITGGIITEFGVYKPDQIKSNF